jgi:hypothetical protein
VRGTSELDGGGGGQKKQKEEDDGAESHRNEIQNMSKNRCTGEVVNDSLGVGVSAGRGGGKEVRFGVARRQSYQPSNPDFTTGYCL